MIPQVRAAALTNYFEVARFVGLDPYRMLRRAGIDPAILADPDDPIPRVSRSRSLLEDSRARIGLPAFGLLMAETRYRGEPRRGRPAAEATEHGARRGRDDHPLSARCSPRRSCSASRRRAKPRSSGPTSPPARPAAGDRTADGDRLPGDQRGGGRALASGKRAFRPRRAGRSRRPPPGLPMSARLRERLQRPRLPDRLARRAQPGRGIGDGAPCPALSRHAGPRARRRLGQASGRGARSICCCPRGAARSSRSAANLGLHPRTLQRLLEKEGRTFATLLNEVRRELALRYLASPTHSVTAVGQMTGYATPKLLHPLVRRRVRHGAGGLARRGARGDGAARTSGSAGLTPTGAKPPFLAARVGTADEGIPPDGF